MHHGRSAPSRLSLADIVEGACQYDRSFEFTVVKCQKSYLKASEIVVSVPRSPGDETVA
jgi:hypothetical protein